MFPEKTTIFIGENNTGKSNLIHALRLIFDPNSKRLETDLTEEDINLVAQSDGEKYFSILVEIGDLQNHQELEAIFRDRIAQDGEETFVTIHGKFEQDEDDIYSWNVQVMPPTERDNDPIPFFGRMSRSIPLYYLDAARDIRSEIRPTGRGILSQLLSNVTLDDVEEEVLKRIREANEALGKNRDISELAKKIAELTSPHIPRGRGDVIMGVASEDPIQLMKGLCLFLKREKDDRYFDINKHGTGLQNLVIISMFRLKISTAGAIQPIFAIEEPEIHLHPQAQRCLIKDIMEIDSPVLLTTHSPIIVEKSHPLKLIRLGYVNNHVKAHQLDKKYIEKEDLIQLSRMMNSGHADALFSKVIIIVEGQTEFITLPVFAEYLGYNLYRDGISIVTAGGNAYSYILRTCNEDNFCIPAVVTYDTDALSSNNILISEAFKAEAISRDDFDIGRKGTKEDRQTILDSIGWIPVIENFEEEIIRNGYLSVVLEVIEHSEAKRSLETFLTKNNLEEGESGVVQYLQTRAGKRLKIRIAKTVSEKIGAIRKVPNCYETAIKNATTLSNNR